MHSTVDIQMLEQWVGEESKSVAFALLALRYLEQGNTDKALQTVLKGLEVYANYPFGHFVAGLCYHTMKDLTEAKNHLDLSVTYDPVNPRAWQLLSEINRQLELNLVAEDCQLRLSGVDAFHAALAAGSTDALTTSEAQEAGETQEEIPDLLEDVPELETPEEGVEEEFNLEDLFSEETEAVEQQQPDVDEIFKEAVGDIAEVDEPEGAQEGEVESSSETETVGAENETNKEQATPKESDEFSDAMDNFFSTLEDVTLEESEKSPVEEEQPSPQPAAQEGSQREEPDDLFDFSQAVEEFINEREEEVLQEQKSEENNQSESQPDIPKDEGEFIIDLDESDTATDTSQEEVAKPPILSPTLGEIYISQGRFQEAIHVFEQLLEQDPDNPHFKRKIREIQNLIDKQKNMEA